MGRKEERGKGWRGNGGRGNATSWLLGGMDAPGSRKLSRHVLDQSVQTAKIRCH